MELLVLLRVEVLVRTGHPTATAFIASGASVVIGGQVCRHGMVITEEMRETGD